MSREIKVRAFSAGKMYEVDTLTYLHGVLKEVLIGSVDMPIKCEPHEVTLMQFTGLKDMNGNEIYEGDIVKNQWEELNQIYWDTEGAGFEATEFHMTKGDMANSEIIGNIYENPDLLTPKELV